MRKKIFCTLISLIIVLSLVGCGSSDAVATPAPAAPAVTEPAPEEPEPEPEPEVVEEAPVIEETVAEEPAPEEEAKVEEEPAVEEPVEEEPAEPTEEEIVEAVLANEEFYEDGAFVPKLYAQSLGYKWWCDGDFSVSSNGTEFFVWYNYGENVKLPGITVMYTDGEKCYEFDVVDRLEEDRTDIIKQRIEDNEDQNSKLYISATIAVLHRLATGESDIRDWKFNDLAYGYFQWDNSPKYFDDGYIDASELTKNEENSFTVSYK